MKTNNHCSLCNSTNIFTFLSRKNTPVLQNSLFKSQVEAKSITRGNLEITKCNNCDFIFNKAFDEKKISYDETYENNQTYSPAFKQHISSLVTYLIDEKKIINHSILEIGCGQGYFLKQLINSPNSKNIGYGFDPAYTGPLTTKENDLFFKEELFGPKSSFPYADTIICRHVIEHISTPLKFLRTIKQSLADKSNYTLFFETPCIEWILKNNVIWDFFYEHCSYFSPKSLTYAFDNSGFSIKKIKKVFNNQYLWIEATPENKKIPSSPINNINHSLILHFKEYEKNFIKELYKKIENLAKKETIAIWGAGAKGATLINLIDPKNSNISYVIDINPNKQNHYIPGTGHRIIHYENIKSYGITVIIITNPNYFNEIENTLKQNKINSRLINLMDLIPIQKKGTFNESDFIQK